MINNPLYCAGNADMQAVPQQRATSKKAPYAKGDGPGQLALED